MAVQKVCLHCKKEFSVPNRRSDDVKYCSRQCKTEAGYLILACKSCGTEFKRKKSDQARSGEPYCSRLCFHADRVGKAPNRDFPDRVVKVCEHCKQQFSVIPYRADKARWCSKECQAASPEWKRECSERQQGEKSWRWAGGKYLSKQGYIWTRSAKNGVRPLTLNHRVVVLLAMLEVEPDHPFIVDVNGEKKLSPEIEVHHIDRDRANNDLGNLLAVTKDAHAQIHHKNRKPRPWECWPREPEHW